MNLIRFCGPIGRVVMALACAVLACSTLFTGAAGAGDVKSGPIKLRMAEPPAVGEATEVQVGGGLEAVASLRAGRFFDSAAVFGNVALKNTSDRPMYYAWYVSFYDEDGQLIACDGQGSGPKQPLQPGEEARLGGCIMLLPRGDIEQIASYQLRLVESDKPVGGK